jgi:hypothetical protein
MTRFASALLAAAMLMAAPALAGNMASPKPSPGAMHSMKSTHAMKGSSMKSSSAKNSSMKSHNMKSNSHMMMGSPKPKSTMNP